VKRIALYGGIGIIFCLILYSFLFADNRSKLNVEEDKITVFTVRKGDFLEFIPVNGTTLPITTVYLDAIEGGVIQRIYKQTGAQVQQGDVILELTNSALELDVLYREAQLYEQINNIRTSRLSLEQNSLNLKNQLAEIEYQLELLEPQSGRYEELISDSLISTRDYEMVAEEHQYYKKRKRMTYHAFKEDSMLRIIQNRQLKDSEQRLWTNLDAVRKIRDNLMITAPIAGQLATNELEIGQSIASGERIGQVDILDKFKVRVAIDELYLPKVDVGQRGTWTFTGQTYKLEVSKIYPNITDGRFEVDMVFVDDQPDGMKRGLTQRIKLELGNPGQALLLATGGFYSDTGGNWVFKVDESGNRAYKQEIKLGRRNPEYYEVMEGLQPGDRVITSSYENFGNNEVLVLK